MIEDDWLGEGGPGPARDFTLAAPVHAMRRVSYDLSLTLPLELASGQTMTALEIQWELFDLARKYADDRGLACVGPETQGSDLLARWEHVLHGLESDPMSLANQLDWVAKYQTHLRLPGTSRAGLGRRPPGRTWTCSTTTCGRPSALLPGCR